jgi:transcriptional regulator with XRE-family HTH domain
MNSFADRLKIIMGSVSGREFAAKLGKSSTTVNQYLKGRTPPADFIVLVCERYQIEHKWLLTGEGPMKRGEEPKAAPGVIDEELLKEAIQAVEEYLEEIKGTLTPEKKAELVMLLCQWHLKEAPESRKINRATVISLVRLAA